MYRNTKKHIGFIQVLFIAAAFTVLFSQNTYAQNCNAELKVEKDRNFKSAAEDGATYVLLLTNKSSQASTFAISTRMLEESCANDTRKTSAANVNLDVALLNNDSRSSFSGSVQVGAGQTKKFIVQVDAPKNTPINTWGCVEVKAVPASCKSQSYSTILSVFVPDTTVE